MSRYGEPDMYIQAGDWLVNTARRKPEAVLLLAAGCALLMRNGRSAFASDRDHRFVPRYAGDSLGQQGRAAGTAPRSSGVGGAVNQVGETAAQYATGLKDRISESASSYGAAAADLAQEARRNISDAAGSYTSAAAEYAQEARRNLADTASSYAGSVAEYAEDARRNLAEQSERLKREAQSALQLTIDSVREQPLMVAALGLAAGAAVAALFPTSEVERRTLGEARDAIAEVASKAGENLMEAAGEAGERLKAGVAERGMNAEGLKDLARDVAEPFTRAAAGKPDEPHSPEQQKSADAPPKGVEPIAGGGSR